MLILEEPAPVADDGGGREAAGGATTARFVRRWVVAVIGGWSLVILAVIAVLPGGGPAGVVVMDGQGRVATVDPVSGLPDLVFDDAAVAPDGSRVYRTRPETGGTRVDAVDPSDGHTESSVVVDERVEIRAVSPRGGAVVLGSPRISSGLYTPEPRARTSLTVVRSSGESQTYDLDGNFEPETFSLDEQRLYLVEFWPALAPDRYYVRQLDLSTRVVTDVGGHQIDIDRDMRGKATAQVMAPDYSRMYTLYTLDVADGPAHDASSGTQHWAFIHVLSLTDDWTHCLFLPVPMGGISRDAVTLAVNPGGDELVVADVATNLVVRIDTSTLTVGTPATMDRLRWNEVRPSAAVDGDGTLYVASGQTVIAVGADLTTVMQAWQAGQTVHHVRLSDDESQLWIALDDHMVVLDLNTWAEIARLDVPEGEGFTFAGPPGQSLTRISVECAC